MRKNYFKSIGLGMALLSLATVASAQFVAFNDHSPTNNTSLTHSNATTYYALGNTGGPLKNIANGALLTAGVKITNSAGALGAGAAGVPNAGSPLANTFNGFVYFGLTTNSTVQIPAGSVVTYTFTNLDSSKRYSFKGGAVRAGSGANTSYPNRWTKVSLVGAASFTDAHSTGVITRAIGPTTDLTASDVAFNSGDNLIGDMVDWEDIQISGNSFSVISRMWSNTTVAFPGYPGGGMTTNAPPYAYAITGIRLEEFNVSGPIVITRQPTNQVGVIGDPVSFNVGVSGATPYFFQWRKNGAPISNATNQTYTIASAVANDAGTYSVLVSNLTSSATSSNAVLTLTNGIPLTITAQPQDVSVAQASPASFSVSVTGSAPRYQWFKNGTAILNATNQIFSIASCVVSDTANYFVVITNKTGRVTSSNALLIVTAPPYVLMAWTNVWKYDQSGNNLGTAWKDIGFDDSAWSSGRGVLAFETDNTVVLPLTNTILSLSNGSGTRVITYYFRAHFTVTNDLNTINIVATNLVDDGAVVYLNNSEIYRINMPSSPAAVNSATRPSAAIEASFIVMNLPTSKLVQGDNVLAVEVHQINDTSSDIDMGLSLAVVPLPPTRLAITNHPPDRTVSESASTTFTVGYTGTQPSFQWYKNGVPIANANQDSFTIAYVTQGDAGTYSVILSNLVNSVTSSNALLNVLVDTNPPTLFLADGTLAATNVLVSFSESIGVLAATNIANYRITNLGGANLVIQSARLTNGTNVLLTTAPRLDSTNYVLFVSNVRDISPRSNLIATASSIPITWQISLMTFNELWDYWDPFPPFEDPNIGTAWRNSVFTIPPEWANNDNARGAFWLGSTELPVPLGKELSESASFVSYYRSQFNFQGSPLGASLKLRHLVDSGAVFYLNGVEILRVNMPSGVISFDTPAISQVNFAGLSDYLDVPVTQLRYGTNLMAVELHSAIPNEVTRAFDMDLQARVMSIVGGPVLITSHPTNQTVMEGQTVTFSFMAAGAGYFQWFRNGTAIAGATNITYTIANVPLSLNNTTYRVVASNTTSSATSSNALLTLTADTTPPALVSAMVSSNNLVTVSFSEPVSLLTATNRLNYAITNAFGPGATILSAVLTNGTNVLLTTTTLAGNYSLVVNNIKDTATVANTITPNSAATVGCQFTIPIVSAWKYDQSGNNLDTEWKEGIYNDTAWPTGLALLYNETAALPAPTNTPLNLNNGGVYITTFYFRQHFSLPAGGNNAVISLRHVIDDGAVFYMNGSEFHRFNMAAGAFNATTQANTNVPDGIFSGPFSIAATNLVGGENVVAVEVHQNGGASSDIVFGAELNITVASVLYPTVIQAPQLIATRQPNGTVVLSWSGNGFTLEQATTLNPPGPVSWSSAPSQSNPYTVSSTNTAKFFRLRY